LCDFGKPAALCSGSPSDVNLGENDHQVWTATRLGGRFSASSPVFDWWNQLGFAAASDQDMMIASTAGLDVTTDGGQAWTAELTQPNGATWQDLAFPSRSVGVVVNNTVNNASQQVGTVYRTTDAGRSWNALSLPSSRPEQRPGHRRGVPFSPLWRQKRYLPRPRPCSGPGARLALCARCWT
jgi:hypothetical protein